MSDALTLAAEPRNQFGKGAARRARVNGQIPAVLYGHGTDPVHVLLPGHATMMALKHANALLTIVVGDTTQLALPKDVQRNAVRRSIDHIDLILVRKGEKVTVDVPIHLIGESISGTIPVQEHTTLSIVAEATHIPESVEVSIEGMSEGDKIVASDIALPAGSELALDPDALVVMITVPRGAVSEADEADAVAAVEVAAKD